MSVNKKHLPLVALALAVIFIASVFAGCGLKTTNDPVVLKIGDVKMRLSEYTSMYNTYYSYYSAYGLYDVSTTEKLYAFQDKVFDLMVNSAVEIYMADQNNVTLDDTEMAAAQTSTDDDMKSMLDSYKKKVDSSITDEAAIEAEATKLMNAALKESGFTYDSYRQYALENNIKSARVEKQIESIKSTVTVTDEEVEARYNNELNTDKVSYTSAPEQYYTDSYSWSMYQEGVQPLYIPAGYIQVKRILLEDETKTDEVAQAIKAGSKTFDDLIKEYSKDTSSTLYLVSKDCKDKYAEGFADAALKLQNIGDVSEAIKTDDGVYFIRLEAKLTEGPVAFEGDVKTSIHDAVLTGAQDDLYDKTVAEWVKSAPVKTYKFRIRQIGVGSGN